jgi:ADP-heptose:LPS heptosyltransferase
MPLLTRIKQLAPGCHVTVFGDPLQQQLVPHLPQIDAFVPLGEGERHYLRAIQHGWRQRGLFDLAVSAKTSPKSWNNLFLALTGARYRLGFAGNKAFERWLTHRTPWSPAYAHSHHQALKTLHLIEPELLQLPEGLEPRLDLTMARSQWDQQHPAGPGPLLCVSVTNNRPTSFLGVKLTAQLLNELAQHTPLRVVVSATPSDVAIAQRLVEQLQMPACATITQSLSAALCLLKASDCLLLGDGGMSHMAAALDRPQLCLFGETSPIEWAPLSKKASVLFHRTAVDQLEPAVISQALRALIKK